MATWYVDKFVNFFNRWKKGYLYTRDRKSFYGVVEEFLLADDFEKSIVVFNSYGTKDKASERLEIPIANVVYFRAVDGPIFNVGKYLSIIKVQKTAVPPPKESIKEVEDKELVCVAFDLEFYTSKKLARVLKKDLKDILLSRLQDLPVVFVKEAKPVELTPALTSTIRKVKKKLKKKH